MDHQSARQLLTKAELPAADHIGSGMEGHVFRVNDDSVAKVWQTAPADRVRNLQAFYAALLELRLPFMTPIIDEVLVIDGVTISLEAPLTGTPLSECIARSVPDPPAFATNAIMHVLTALRSTEVELEIPTLALVGVMADTGKSTNRLLTVDQQKVNRYGDQLRTVVPGFDHIWDAIQSDLRRQPEGERYVIHGDLVPPNILLAEDLSVSAIVDWGFLVMWEIPHSNPRSLPAFLTCTDHTIATSTTSCSNDASKRLAKIGNIC